MAIPLEQLDCPARDEVIAWIKDRQPHGRGAAKFIRRAADMTWGFDKKIPAAVILSWWKQSLRVANSSKLQAADFQPGARTFKRKRRKPGTTTTAHPSTA